MKTGDEISRGHKQQIAEMADKIRRQKRELGLLQATCAQRSLALDAMHYVWCTSCKSGVNRHGAAPTLTEEVLAEAERNVRRLRTWFDNQVFQTAWWKALTEDERKELENLDSWRLARDKALALGVKRGVIEPGAGRAPDVISVLGSLAGFPIVP